MCCVFHPLLSDGPWSWRCRTVAAAAPTCRARLRRRQRPSGRLKKCPLGRMKPLLPRQELGVPTSGVRGSPTLAPDAASLLPQGVPEAQAGGASFTFCLAWPGHAQKSQPPCPSLGSNHSRESNHLSAKPWGGGSEYGGLSWAPVGQGRRQANPSLRQGWEASLPLHQPHELADVPGQQLRLLEGSEVAPAGHVGVGDELRVLGPHPLLRQVH